MRLIQSQTQLRYFRSRFARQFNGSNFFRCRFFMSIGSVHFIEIEIDMHAQFLGGTGLMFRSPGILVFKNLIQSFLKLRSIKDPL